jgi:uncharacterized cupredoxin-like copper-binding protein
MRVVEWIFHASEQTTYSFICSHPTVYDFGANGRIDIFNIGCGLVVWIQNRL